MPFLIMVMGSGQTGLRPVKTDLPVQSSPLHCFKNVDAAQVMCVLCGKIQEFLKATRSDGEPDVLTSYLTSKPGISTFLLQIPPFSAYLTFLLWQLMASSSCGLGVALRQATWATANPVPASRAMQVVPEIEKCQSSCRENRLYFVSSLQGEGLGTSRELVCTHVWYYFFLFIILCTGSKKKIAK